MGMQTLSCISHLHEFVMDRAMDAKKAAFRRPRVPVEWIEGVSEEPSAGATNGQRRRPCRSSVAPPSAGHARGLSVSLTAGVHVVNVSHAAARA